MHIRQYIKTLFKKELQSLLGCKYKVIELINTSPLDHYDDLPAIVINYETEKFTYNQEMRKSNSIINRTCNLSVRIIASGECADDIIDKFGIDFELFLSDLNLRISKDLSNYKPINNVILTDYDTENEADVKVGRYYLQINAYHLDNKVEFNYYD